MKNSKLTKIILVAIVALIALVMVKNTVFAATELPTNSLLPTNTATNNATENNTVNNTSANNTVLTTNNESSYNNNASLPNTGVTDTMPVVVLVVALAISAVYAYKKMQDYKNI